jgi:alpha-1,6-mannosyltransferase
MLTTTPILYTPGCTGERIPGALRVLDITMFYAEASGGVRTYLAAKGLALARRGVSHALVVPDRRDSISMDGESRVYRLRSPRVPTTPGYRLLVSPQAVERIIHEERPDVIELGSPFLVPFLVRWATRGRMRPPVVGFYHSDLVRTYAIPYLGRLGSRVEALGVGAARRYVRSVYGRCDATVAASTSVARELRELGIPNVHQISLGVDLELFTPERRSGALREREGIPAGRPIGIFAGRMCPEKRLDVVLDAHARLGSGERPHLVLVGMGQQQEAIASRAAMDGFLTILPYQHDRGRLADLLADADFYLAAGPGETFGLAVAEAMAAGLGVLGVDSGAVPDRLEGSGAGELYRNGDVEDCARAMALLGGQVGPEMRHRARAHALTSFGWEGTFDRLLELYRSLAGMGAGLRAGTETVPG